MCKLFLLPALLILACQGGGMVVQPKDSSTLSDSAADTALPGATLFISEVMADNQGTLADGDGDYSDWIEVFNPTRDTVDLEGWGLSDDTDDPFRWTAPAGTRLLPGEYLLVFASGKGILAPAGENHAAFRLDADGDDVVLTRPDGSTAYTLAFPAQEADISYGLAQVVADSTVVQDGSNAWLRVGDDEQQTDVVLPVGFDGSAASGGEEENAALFKQTEQSSDGYGFTGLQAVDGELSTFSHTADADLDSWWMVDLDGNWSIDRILIYNRLNCCPERLYNLTVEILDADEQVLWTSPLLNPVAEGQAPSTPGDLLTVSPAAPLVGNRVRVCKQAVNGAGSSEWMSLAEVEVWASPAAPYTGLIASDIGALMAGVDAEAWLEIPFTAEGSLWDRATLTLRYDDGFSAWLADEPVASANAGDGLASAAHSADAEESFPVDPRLLTTGENTLLMQGLNLTADDDDFLMGATLTLQTIETGTTAWFDVPTPGAPNSEGFAGFVDTPQVSAERGFYDQPFTLVLTSGTPGATLAYTLDGSAPSHENGQQVVAASQDMPEARIQVDTTTVLRAMAHAEGSADSDFITHSYLFLADVIRQPATPEGFPTIWDGMSQDPVAADYEMDPEVVDDPAYTDDLLAGLRAIPTLSIVMDPDDLFGAETGIYVHSLQRGDEWERPASIEYILPDGSSGFQENAGVRIHGYGWRYHSNTRKHALRLEFSPDYGPSKLDFPLFPDAPVDSFDSIVLRCQGSRGWQDFRDPAQSQYLRDAFARDTARDMGKVDGHAIFVHLYLNGLYWGLYNPVERPDAGFGEEYFGGSDDDYDAINRRTSTNEAIDGDLEAYNALLALADEDVSSDAVYQAIQATLDVDDLIDYMLIHQYTTNRDGPCCYSHNNMRGIRKREEGAQFRFFVWDMEYSLWNATDSYNIDIDVSGSASHVYARLHNNADFRARYSERAGMHLTGDGALTPTASLARWNTRSTEIYDAVVAESARWGDANREPPYTRDVEWMAERERLINEYFPYRTGYLIQYLQAAGLMEP